MNLTKKQSYFTLIPFLIMVGAVAMSGMQFLPGEWYAHLVKPGWTPPNWLFPPVWSLLYLMIAIAGWLIFHGDNRSLRVLWIIQLVLNGLWSWIFFGLHHIGLGMIDIFAMLACIACIVIISSKEDPVRWFMTPYLIWVSYASSLNLAMYFLNPA